MPEGFYRKRLTKHDFRVRGAPTGMDLKAHGIKKREIWMNIQFAQKFAQVIEKK